MIEKAINYIKNLFENEASGHDAFHTLRVYKLALKLAKEENADEEICALAALLHDTDDRKLFPETCATKAHARSFLKENGADDEMIEKIITIIEEVSFAGKDSKVPSTLEGKCVQDADRLDAIGAIGIARTFAYGGSKGSLIYDENIKPNLNMDKETYYNHRTTTINHFYEKLLLLKDMMNTETAKCLAKQRHEYMVEYLQEFYDEVNGVK